MIHDRAVLCSNWPRQTNGMLTAPRGKDRTMAGTKGRRHSRRLEVPPMWSTQSLTAAVGGFVSVVLLLVLFKASTRHRSTAPSRVHESPQDIPPRVLAALDAVLVLGGGAPRSSDDPPAYVRRRCDDAAAVVRRFRAAPGPRGGWRRRNDGGARRNLPVLCLSAGTAHVPQLLAPDGLPVWEATASAAYLWRRHNLTDLFVETTSYDTMGNAYFARMSHTEHNGWRRLLVVTSQFHMARTKAIFDWIFGVDNQQAYELQYLVSPDVGLTAEALLARLDREAASLESVQRLARSHRSLREVWRFLTSEHALYTAIKLVERAETSSKETGELVRESYGA